MKRLTTFSLITLLFSLSGGADSIRSSGQAASFVHADQVTDDTADLQVSDIVVLPQGRCQPLPGHGTHANCASHGWRNVGPGSPGVWATVAVDPAGSGVIYVGSIGGGVRKSTDNGATWSTVSSGLNGTAVFSLAMDALGPDTIYAGVLGIATTAPGGVFKSTNGGLTWTLLAQTATTIPLSLTADPHVRGVVFVGGLGGIINRTIDGGANWTRIFSGTSPITSIVIDPLNSNIVYASTLGGLLKSTDAGLSWILVSSLTPKTLWGFAMDPANDHLLYAATDANGVWRSLDAGVSWEATGMLPPVPFSLAIDPSPTHTIFAATTEGVWESSDEGSTWQPTALVDTKAISITIAPGGVLYVGTTAGLAISQDLGTTWTDPDPSEGGAQAFGYAVTVDPTFGRKLFVSTLGSTVLISDNRGTSWAAVGTNYTAREARRITVDPTDSNRVYSGSLYSGLFKSVDGGATWSRRNFGSGIVYVWIPVVDPVSPNIVYAGTVGEGLFKSEDYGDTWKSVPGLPTLVQGVTVDRRNDNEVFAATGAGVFRSHDAGQTWAIVLDRPAWSITIVGGDSQAVYATTKSAGVYRSRDGGDTWFPINIGITDLQMGRAAPVVVDPRHSQVLYVGSEGGGGVFKSQDGGDSWFAVNVGLFDTSVLGLAADPHRPRTLYVSGPHGIFATTTGGE
jgi:photosystem II stability/assembly factor-like uncharacterized protein